MLRTEQSNHYVQKIGGFRTNSAANIWADNIVQAQGTCLSHTE